MMFKYMQYMLQYLKLSNSLKLCHVMQRGMAYVFNVLCHENMILIILMPRSDLPRSATDATNISTHGGHLRHTGRPQCVKQSRS